MPGTIDYEPTPVSPSRPPAVVTVYRYDPLAGDGEKYQLMPNVRLVEVHEQRGPHPSAGRVRYSFDEVQTYLDPECPKRAEEVWGLTATGPYVFHLDERVICHAYDPSAEDAEDYAIAFDGHVGYPQLDLGGDREAVTVAAYGRPVRLWDEVVRHAYQRDADDPAAGTVVKVPLRVRFNPEAQPNCTADDADEGAGNPDAHPVFLDALVARELQKEDPKRAAYWSVAGAVRYLLYTHNADERYVKNPPADAIKELFDSWAAVSGDDDDVDPADPDSYIAYPIEVPDLDVTGDTLPVALQKLIEPHGFAYRFVVSKTAPDEDDDGNRTGGGDPEWRFEFYRVDVEEPLKVLRLGAAQEDLDPTRSNTQSVSLARDGEIMNAWVGLTAPTLIEAGIVLAPLFDVVPADADPSNLTQWDQTSGAWDPEKYRLFGADETGEGHWSGTAFVTGDTPDFNDLLGVKTPEGEFTYSVRRRPGRNHLLTKIDSEEDEHKSPDSPKERRRAALYISTDYDGPKPGVWDHTGTWQEVAPGHGWELLETRLGVRLTTQDPENWNIGTPPVGGSPAIGGGVNPYPGGLVRVVKGTADPTVEDAGREFALMLVTALETDETLGSDKETKLSRREASPVGYEVLRADELRDRFVVELRHESSPWRDSTKGKREKLKDEAAALKNHLRARRKAHELAVVAGSALIPRITYAYDVGDRVSGVTGRDLDFTMNVVSGEEAPVYPVVEGITWTFEDRQQTQLSLSDRRADPPPEKRV